MTGFAALLLLLSSPAAAQRGMGATMCACPSGGHKPLGSAASCQVACYGESAGGGGGSANSAAAAQLGQAIGAGIVDMFKQAAAAKAAAAREAAIANARYQEQQRIEAEARKERLLSGMQGVESGETLGLMLGDEPVADSIGAVFARARARHDKEAALRRAALERLAGKPDEGWCKLHLPQALVMPLRSSGDDRSYPAKISKFSQDRAEWDKRCDGPSASGPTSLDGDLALLQREPKAPRPAKAPAVAAAPAPAAAPAAPVLQAGGLALMTDDAPSRPAPKKEAPPAPAAEAVTAPAHEPPADAPQAGGLALMTDDAPAPPAQPKGWTASAAEVKAPHSVEAGAPEMPPAPAPVFPSAPPAREAAVALSAGSPPAAPGAFAFMKIASAAAPRERSNEKPKYALPMLTKVLAVEEGVAFAAASVKVLYNLGAAPSETVRTKTVLVYEKDEADKPAFEAENGIAVLPAGSVEWKDLTAESAGPNRWLPAEVKR